MTPSIDNNTGDAAIADAARSISNDATAGMKEFATAQEARVARLAAVRDRLQKSPNTPASTMQRLDEAILASTAVAQTMAELADRIARRPTVDPADLAVFGRVLDAQGMGAAALYVRLSDSTGSLKAGSRVKTDSSGDFSLVLKSCEVPATASELVVAVEDASGARLAASNPVTPKAGSPVYVELTLSGEHSTLPSSS